MQKILNLVNKSQKLLTDISKRKRRWLMHILRYGCVLRNGVREKKERRLTGGAMIVNEIKSEKAQKNKKKS